MPCCSSNNYRNEQIPYKVVPQRQYLLIILNNIPLLVKELGIPKSRQVGGRATSLNDKESQFYDIQKIMRAEPKSGFLNAIKDDIPAIKLFKYRSLITRDPTKASEVRDQMLKIALDNKLIGEYRLIFECLKQKEEQNQVHLKMREAMIQEASPLQALQKNFKIQQNYPQYASTLLKLGKLFFSYGDYKQCSDALEALSNLNENNHQVKYEEYTNELALSFYYMNESYCLSRYNNRPIQKALLQKMPEICIIRDINNIDFRRNLDKPFENVIKMGLTNLQLSKNRVIGYGDIGFLFSLLSIAYKKKKDIISTKWSSKLENQYVNNHYKEVLETLEKERESRCYLPIINKMYEQCYKIIRSKILTQVISSFDRCPFSIIEQMTGMDEGKVRLFAKHNSDCPYLFDPVTSSVVFRKNAPLYKQVTKLLATLQNKFSEETAYISGRIEPDDEDDKNEGPYLGRIHSGGRSGGRMGYSGGMMGPFGGRRKDF